LALDGSRQVFTHITTKIKDTAADNDVIRDGSTSESPCHLPRHIIAMEISMQASRIKWDENHLIKTHLSDAKNRVLPF
jgi:hypothetical protein